VPAEVDWNLVSEWGAEWMVEWDREIRAGKH
jgi:hypothetical protein